MRTILFLFLGVFSAVPRLLYAQSLTFQGSVVEKNGRTPIPYASVRLIKEKVSTSADDKGTFRLITLNPIADDTLIISAVSYRPVKIPASRFTHKQIIRLEDDMQFLNEVKIAARAKRKTKTLNPLSFEEIKGIQIVYSGGGTQIARKFTAPTEFSRLKQVSLKRYLKTIHPFENQNCRFRIRVYDVDETTGAPGNDLGRQVIEVEETVLKQVVSIDLTKYNIVIPKKAFFIAIEWLYIGFNEYIHIYLEPRSNSVFESDRGSTAAMLRYDIEYEPRIDIEEFDSRKDYRLTVYQKHHDGTWGNHGMDPPPAISAVITYTVLKK